MVPEAPPAIAGRGGGDRSFACSDGSVRGALSGPRFPPADAGSGTSGQARPAPGNGIARRVPRRSPKRAGPITEDTGSSRVGG